MLVDRVLAPMSGIPPLPLLAFAMIGAEKDQLSRRFDSFTSASLYGRYAATHEEGVDVRDLSRYLPESRSGVFGSLLFDYFPEHEVALEQAFEVTAKGGVFFTHIAPHRLANGGNPPEIAHTIEPRSDYFSYVPENANMPSIKVGRSWFLEALEQAGFKPTWVSIEDSDTASIEWFVGVKPTKPPTLTTRAQPKLLHTEPFSRTCSIPVDPAHGFKRVTIELSAPTLPTAGSQVDFAEHVLDRDRAPTDTVIACTRGAVVVSDDLGKSWNYIPVPELSETGLRNSFTAHDGTHLLQGRSAATLGIPRTDETLDAPIAVFNRDWRLIDCVTPGVSMWHGSRSIDEANGVIVYAEYPDNRATYSAGFDPTNPAPDQLEILHDSRLFRSIDQGRSWKPALSVNWRTIRHFHTVAADPWQPGRFWASSGDRPDECRVWQSLDHGLTWTEIQSDLPTEELSPAVGDARSALRYTDLVVRRDDLIWGADDWLGAGWARDAALPVSRRGGSRLFHSPKDAPWKPETIGYVGNPIRSLIDVGPAYIVITEAKGKCGLGYRPQVLLLSKSKPFLLTPLFTVDNFGDPPATAFTVSRASRAAKDGVFFTFRRPTDVFPSGANVLRWHVAFD